MLAEGGLRSHAGYLLSLAGVVWLVVVLLTPGARAQTEEQSRAVARELAVEGKELYEAGDFAAALDRFSRAEALVPVPTLSLYAARCLAALGRRVEAADRYLTIDAMPVDPRAPAGYQRTQVAAKEAARVERAALLPKLGQVELAVDGPRPERVSIDGEQAALALLDSTIPVDPGDHVFRAELGSAEWEQKVTVAEGETVRLRVRLPPGAAATPAAGAAGSGDSLGHSSALGTVGWVMVAVGSAGVVAGSVILGLALDREATLADLCPERTCLQSQVGSDVEADIGSYERLRAASVATLIAGGLLTAGGVAMVLATPDGDPSSALIVRPALGGLTVHGSF